MNVEEKAQAVMAAASSITSLVPSSKIRVPGSWQDLTPPYIIHLPITMRPDAQTYARRTADGLRTFDAYQVSVFASTYSSGRAIVNAVLAALGGRKGKFTFQAATGSIYVGKDDTSGISLHHFAAHFAVSGHES